MIQGYMAETDTRNKTDYQLVSAGRDLLAQFQNTIMEQYKADIIAEQNRQELIERVK